MPAKAKPPKITESRTPDRARWYASKYARFGALGIVAAAAAVAIAVAFGSSGGSSPAPTTPGKVKAIGPIVLSAARLKGIAGGLNQPIYWVGPVVGERYELTRTTTNDVFVRYLPEGVEAGTHQREYPLIVTYPYKGALAALKASHDGPQLTVAGGRGGIAEVERRSRTNAHVAFPHVNYQIEVYNPYAPAARRLATSAALQPVP